MQSAEQLDSKLKNFFYSKKTKSNYFKVDSREIPKYTNEYWTAKQRQSSSLHEVSYRACFKAELPRFFIEQFSKAGDTIYDPFSGRGTTAIEAALNQRVAIANDINPLSKILLKPRLTPPTVEQVEKRLAKIKIDYRRRAEIDLSMFYHPKTEAEIVSIKYYLENKKEDNTDKWIRMLATNRLSGHSKGFFSVYTLPPNQAVTAERQIKINKRLKQKPEYKDTKEIILKKTKSLLRNLNSEQLKNLTNSSNKHQLFSSDSRRTKRISNDSVSLTITSPPFLNVINYSEDNWLRCWFNSIDHKKINQKITTPSNLDHWSNIMQKVFCELYRITKPKGWLAFEVGEVNNGKIKLDESVIPLGENSGFNSRAILINQQKFTKTANIWGVKNNSKGTNTNRIVLFQK